MKTTELFAKRVFTDEVMKKTLSKSTYESLRETIKYGKPLDESIANEVAAAIKEWAIGLGATHFTHWFIPLIPNPAEKHDAFIDRDDDGSIILKFSGKNLMKGEPDASSFPSGGLRATCRARGYTAWDPTAPIYIKEDGDRKTLIIPTVFFSYTGEVLDRKAPLLRSINALDVQAKRIFKLFGYNDVKSIIENVGPEQEYFLVNEQKYLQREDLIYTGRTLFGALPPKNQELEDHYFGPLKSNIASFMTELDNELWEYGILSKTDHNEVAPAQHETAPLFSEGNMACDQNQIVMDCMRRLARKHGLVALLHEKPYAGVNGSGKHNNWSIQSDTGINMLDPGKTPHTNLLFQLTLACVLKAIDEHAVLLRLSASNPGNDHRLGANEAPPAIISAFLGEQLEDIVRQIIENGEATSSISPGKLDTNIKQVPVLGIEPTDRNRTSPFAFTGNKFEFRMVASSVNIASANTVLNSITAEAFKEAADELEGSKDFTKDVKAYICKTLREHQRIIFNGDGYSQDWVNESAERGLPNVRTFVEAVDALTDPKTIKMYETLGILNEKELIARAECDYEEYAKTINIEAKTMLEMARTKYIPSVMKYVDTLARSASHLKNLSDTLDATVYTDSLDKVLKLLTRANNACDALEKTVVKANKLPDGKERALFYKNKIVPAMAKLRAPIDKLELIVDRSYWPVPTYGELVFEV